MENIDHKQNFEQKIASNASEYQAFQSYVGKVLGVLTINLLITFAVAWASYHFQLAHYIDDSPKLHIAIVLVPFLVIIWMAGLMIKNKKSPKTAVGIFYSWGIFEGLSISVTFLYVPAHLVLAALGLTCFAFISMAAAGRANLIDMRKYGGVLFGLLILGLIAAFSTIFIQVELYVIVVCLSIVALFCFTVVYDIQKLEEEYLDAKVSGNETVFAVWGAIALYLDFLIIFKYLLKALEVFYNKK